MDEITPEFLQEMKEKLAAERDRIITLAVKTRKEEMVLDQDDLPDEMDLASSEYNQAIAFRLRGREKHLLSKIEEALERIEDGSYGYCEVCEEPIGDARLRARPVATYCISCKEEQERREKNYS